MNTKHQEQRLCITLSFEQHSRLKQIVNDLDSNFSHVGRSFIKAQLPTICPEDIGKAIYYDRKSRAYYTQWVKQVLYDDLMAKAKELYAAQDVISRACILKGCEQYEGTN